MRSQHASTSKARADTSETDRASISSAFLPRGLTPSRMSATDITRRQLRQGVQSVNTRRATSTRALVQAFR
eukprot:3484551-Rhodomonas_salina.1